jgi:hypothetical protein
MLVSGIVSKLEHEGGRDSKKIYLEVKINKILAICYDGPGLLDDPQPYYKNTSQSLLDQQFISDNLIFYQDVSKHNITGFIRKHDVGEQLTFRYLITRYHISTMTSMRNWQKELC